MTQFTTYVNSFPRQAVSKREKNEEWRQQCVDAGLKITSDSGTSRRSSSKNKSRNYKLYNGIFDKSDMEFELHPISGKNLSFPATLQYRDIASPIFNLLFGEEYKRGTKFIVRGTDDEIHSSKEKAKKDAIISMLDQLVKAQNPQQQENSQQNVQTPEELEKYYNYSYEDIRESIATKILRYLYKNLNIDKEFQTAWEDALLAGEELFSVDIVANEPVAIRENPLELSYLLAPNSFIMDDADLIVKKTFMPIGKIIDNFYTSLTPAQIQELEAFHDDRLFLGDSSFVLPGKEFVKGEEELPFSGQGDIGGYIDHEGNLSVIRVVWKSRKKIGFLTYIDELGTEQEDVVSEDYKPDKNNPDESIEWTWINEYWEGTKIGDKIYINMGPRPHQFRKMDNISYCRSGFIGTIYNANNSQAISLMDRLVPWIYLYVTLWYRTELLIAANQGKIALIDVSLIPDGWEVEKWIYYASVMKFGFVDSFNEGKKGQATGKLAGSISTQNKVLDLETGNAIQGHISLLQYVEDRLSELSGVTKQRKGAIAEREAVGNVEKTIVQSSHITEKWFQIHNWTKQRVLETLIEAAKEAWKGKSKKLQYVADDMATIFFEVDGNEFVNSEFGVFVTDSSKDQEALQSLKQLTQVALQSEKIEFSDVVDLYLSDSLSDIKNKLKDSERKKSEAQQEAVMADVQEKRDLLQKEYDLKIDEMNRDDINKEKDRISKEEIAIIQLDSKEYIADRNRDGIPDNSEFDREGEQALALEREKFANQKYIEERKANLEDRKLRLSSEKQKSDERLKEKALVISKKQKTQQKPKKKK